MTIKNVDGLPVVGWLVNWSATGYEVPRADLVALLTKVGIDPNVARAVLPKNALGRAFKEHAKGHDKFHRKVSDGSERAVFAILETEVSNIDEIGIETTTKGYYDKSTHSPKVSGQNKSKVEESYGKRLETYASDQFRSIVLRYVKRYCSAVTYLDTGNLYFIPATKKAELDKLIELFRVIGPPVKLNIKEEISTTQVRAVMWTLATKEIVADIAKLKEDFNEIGDETSARSMQLSLSKYDSLKTKVEMFETVLSAEAGNLKQQLDDLNKAVRARMTA